MLPTVNKNLHLMNKGQNSKISSLMKIELNYPILNLRNFHKLATLKMNEWINDSQPKIFQVHNHNSVACLDDHHFLNRDQCHCLFTKSFGNKLSNSALGASL